MTKHIVLLRAINLGGRNKVAMAPLREMLEKNGYSDVDTYLQSGNAVVASEKESQEIAQDIRALVKKHFTCDVPIIVRSAEQLAAACAAYPYGEANPKQSGIVFLAAPVDGAIDASAFAPDECVVHGGEVFVHCPTGFRDTKLTNNWVEKQAGSDGTRRNWNTVIKLVEMVNG